MPDVDVKMVFASMDAMGKEFDDAAKQIGESLEQMKKIAQILEQGALQGKGGDTFVQAIKTKLVPKMDELKRKLEEESKDIKAAVGATRRGEKSSKNRFSDN
jgi:WXG100 family type VII secretion target